MLHQEMNFLYGDPQLKSHEMTKVSGDQIEGHPGFNEVDLSHQTMNMEEIIFPQTCMLVTVFFASSLQSMKLIIFGVFYPCSVLLFHPPFILMLLDLATLLPNHSVGLDSVLCTYSPVLYVEFQYMICQNVTSIREEVLRGMNTKWKSWNNLIRLVFLPTSLHFKHHGLQMVHDIPYSSTNPTITHTPSTIFPTTTQACPHSRSTITYFILLVPLND